MRTGSPGIAASYYRRAYDKSPGGETVLKRYQALRENDEDAAALDALAGWLANNPDDHRVRLVYASALIDRNDTAAAISEHERLIAALPNSAALFNNLALLYHRAGDDRALAMAVRANELAPDEPSIIDTLGWMMVQAGDLDAGLDVLRDAENPSLDPSGGEVPYRRGAGEAGPGR